MTIKVNGEDIHIGETSLTVSELLVRNKVEAPDMVTVQINGEFLDRALFFSKTLREKDEVDFLYYLGGGSCR